MRALLLRLMTAWRVLRGSPGRGAPTAFQGVEWRPGYYPVDSACAGFPFAFKEMTLQHRIRLRPMEDRRAEEGVLSTELNESWLAVEAGIMAESLLLPEAEGSDDLDCPSAEAVLALGGRWPDAYVHLRHLVLAPYYEEVSTGNRQQRSLRRWRYTRRGLTWLRKAAEIA